VRTKTKTYFGTKITLQWSFVSRNGFKPMKDHILDEGMLYYDGKPSRVDQTSFPADVTSSNFPQTFKTKLKSHSFSASFP